MKMQGTKNANRIERKPIFRLILSKYNEYLRVLCYLEIASSAPYTQGYAGFLAMTTIRMKLRVI